jgi:DNA-damage-inducible protein J
MVDANGFTPAEAAELRRRIADVAKGDVTAHSVIEI